MTGELDESAAARHLLDRYGDRVERRGSPLFLEARAAPDGRLLTHEIRAREGFLGRMAGPAWSAAALVATGRLRSLDAAHEPPAVLVPGLSGGLRIACLVSRRGVTGWRMRLPDGSFYEEVPEEGFMLDMLRRSLGLPTPPPPTSPAPLDLTAWIASIRTSALIAGEPLGWEQAVALHTALGDRPVADVDQAESLIRAPTPPEDWESLRLFVASGFDSDGTPSPELAGWMDAGMFARWMLRELPPVEEMLADVQASLRPGAYRRLCHLARALAYPACVR
jgi:hypothetical protein